MLKLIGFLLLGAFNTAYSVEQNFICEHADDPTTLSCPSGHVINPVSISYGRTGADKCYRPPTDGAIDPRVRDANCFVEEPRDLEAIWRACLRQPSCTLHVVFNELEACAGSDLQGNDCSQVTLPDPCLGVGKYINMEYECIQSTSYSLEQSFICEHADDPTTLSCPSGHVINPVSIWYGRTGPDQCYRPPTDGPIDPRVRDANCFVDSPAELDKVWQACQGEPTCTVHVVYNELKACKDSDECFEDVLPDPCGGVGKYISLEYDCIPRTHSDDFLVQLYRDLRTTY